MLGVILEVSTDSKTQHFWFLCFSCWAAEQVEREIQCPMGRGLQCLAPPCSVAAPSTEIWFFSAALPLNSQRFALSATSKDNFSDINGRIVFYCRGFQSGFQTPWRMRFVPVVIIPMRNCFTHTFAHLKTWVKTPQAEIFLFYLGNSVAGAESEQISMGWFWGGTICF